MKNDIRLDLFDDAIARFQSGEDLKTILKSLPQDEELIEMVQTAARLLLPEEDVMQSALTAQQRSKQTFLQAALAQESDKQKRGFVGWLQGLRFAAQLGLVALVLIASLGITGIVSAQALPGQPLYSVKMLFEQTQLAFTRDSRGRLQLEEILDARRVNEVIRLQKSESRQNVQFAGWMQQNSDGTWQVQGIPVVLDEQSPLWNPMLNGAYVEVNGVLNQQGVIVRQVELRLFKLHGTLQFSNDDIWLVNGVPLKISAQMQAQVVLKPGLQVDVTAIRLSDDQYMALVINAAAKNSTESENLSPPSIPGLTPTELPSQSGLNQQILKETPAQQVIEATLDLDEPEVLKEQVITVIYTETESHESTIEEHGNSNVTPQPTPQPEESDEPDHENGPTKTKKPDDD